MDAAERAPVMLLGSAGVGRELVVALQRLGAAVIAVDGDRDTPLRGIADKSVVADVTDTDELTATIRRLRPRWLVNAADGVCVRALIAAAESGSTDLVPGIRAARLCSDFEAMHRLAADELGLPTVPFWFAGSVDELRSIVRDAGLPIVVRPAAGPSGAGQSLLIRAEDVEPAWQHAVSVMSPQTRPRVLAETVVDIDHRVTLLAVRSNGPVGPVLEFCAPIGHRETEGGSGHLVLESWQPQSLSAAAGEAAKSIAARVARALGGRGLFGIELAISGDEVYFAGVTARPSDIAWVTLRTQRLSGFELQARAILGLPVDTILISPGAARLICLADGAVSASDRPAGPQRSPNGAAALSDALAVTESDVLLFDSDRPAPGRRLGVAVATAPGVSAARDRAEQASAALDKLWL